MNKDELISSLPIKQHEFTVRYWERRDLDLLAQWPSYPFPYEPFNFSFRNMSPKEKNEYFTDREKSLNRITLMVDHRSKRAIGYLSLVEIDWGEMMVNNMAFRIEPSWCGQGVGKKSLHIVTQWCFEGGFTALRLDVAASNERAIRCYRDCGFGEAGESWRNDMKLLEIDLDEERYGFLRAHVRLKDGVPQLRFLWMQIER